MEQTIVWQIALAHRVRLAAYGREPEPYVVSHPTGLPPQGGGGQFVHPTEQRFDQVGGHAPEQ